VALGRFADQLFAIVGRDFLFYDPAALKLVVDHIE